MSKIVHLKVEYYPRGEKKKTHFLIKTSAETWDKRSADKRKSYINGALQVAGGVGSRIITWKETRRTKT